MIILSFTDSHGDIAGFERARETIKQADVVLLTGDITHFGDSAATVEVLDSFRDDAKRILALPGNCDYPTVNQYLEKRELSLHGRHKIIDGIGFVGIGKSLPCPGRTPGEMTEAQFETMFEKALKDVPSDIPLVFVMHQPPSDTVNDAIHSGAHVGSKTIRKYIEAYKPLVCFTGHIHEGKGIDQIGETRIINPGPSRFGCYAYAEIEKGQLKQLEIRTS